MSILDKLLKKRGIEHIEELSQEERVQFDNWNRVLSKETLKLEDIETHCKNEVKKIQDKFKDSRNVEDDRFYKACLHVYLNILALFEADQVQRESLEKHLNQILNEVN